MLVGQECLPVLLSALKTLGESTEQPKPDLYPGETPAFPHSSRGTPISHQLSSLASAVPELQEIRKVHTDTGRALTCCLKMKHSFVTLSHIMSPSQSSAFAVLEGKRSATPLRSLLQVERLFIHLLLSSSLALMRVLAQSGAWK